MVCASQADFERTMWLEHILDSIHKCNSKVHGIGGHRKLKETTSGASVTGGRRNATHTLTTVASVPFLMTENSK